MGHKGLSRIYMDNAATTFPKPKAVLDAMVHYARCIGASGGRGAYEEARESVRILTECRERLCQLFHGEKPEQFVYTFNCTDALNLAIKGMLRPGQPNHVICTEIDHNSILRPLNALKKEGLVEVTRIRVEPSTGLIDPGDIPRALRRHTRLIAITHASNVTGTLQPLRQIGALTQEYGVPLLVDAAQSAGHVPIDLQADHVDLLAAPGHKGLLGPLGTGFLYIRPGLEKQLRTLREGGTGSISDHADQPEFMPDKFEAGSHNAIGIAGLLAGVRWLGERTIQKVAAHEKALMQTFLGAITDIEALACYGPRDVKHRVGVFSVAIEGLKPGELALRLEVEYGILTRPGLHCAPLIHRVLGTAENGGTTRLSFGPYLTKNNVLHAADALAEVARSARPVRCRTALVS